MLRSISTLILFLLCFSVSSQDFSNRGKEFWIPYPEHIDGTLSAMGIYITSDVTATVNIKVGTLSLPAFTVSPGGVVRKFIGPGNSGDAPNTAVHMGGIQDGIGSGKAIQVLADKPVVVFAHIIRTARSGATLVLPKTVWGNEYIVPSHPNTGNNQSYGEINIIASQPNTEVEITPSCALRSGRPAGTAFRIKIPNVGDVYQLQASRDLDLSGTTVKAVSSGTTGCLPIAVFSASTWSQFPCGDNNGGGDNLYQQLFPISTWGKEFITSPLKKEVNNAADNNTDIIRVYVQNTSTVVTKIENGISSNLGPIITPGNYYQYTTSNPTLLRSNEPIQVAQFVTSQFCGNPASSSDPEMIVLSPVEQTINNISVFSAHRSYVPAGQSQIDNHYINVIMKTANSGSFKINGLAPTSTFIPIAGTSYAYLKENLTNAAATNPVFKLTADSGFNALAYGFGRVESYGYNAGTNVKDLYQFVTVQTSTANVNAPITCRGTPFFLSMTFPYQPTSISWVFGSALNAAGFADVSINNPVATETSVVNGKSLYRYQLPNQYQISTPGQYSFKILASNPTPDGCSGEQEVNIDFEVLPMPVADFDATEVCKGSAMTFTDKSNLASRSRKGAFWSFGDNNTSDQLNPNYTYASDGAYNVKYVVTNDIGCISDTVTKAVKVIASPTATISGTDSACLGGTFPLVTFTGDKGTSPYTFTYTINGGTSQTVTSAAGNTATVAVPTSTAGIFNYQLVRVSENSTQKCAQNQSGTAVVTILTSPKASISGTAAVCHQSTVAPIVTFTGSQGIAPYTFTYTINGGAPQTLTTTTGSSATITAPTNTPGTFTYALVSVSDANGIECQQPASGTAVITVNPLPTASISGTSTVCLNAPSPQITFTGANGTAPYTFSYRINGGTVQTIATTTGNSINIAAPTSARGTFTYDLVSVRESSSTTCSQDQTGQAIITILPNPTATISGTATVCEKATAPSITFTGNNGDAPYTFTYTINGGTPQTLTTTSGSSATVTAPTSTPGTYTYALVSVADANGTQCQQPATGTATITVNPLPTATISGNTSVCRNADAPKITFTGANATAPYTFSYRINGGATQTITTTSGNSVTLDVPTATAGTFNYELLSVKESSGTTCSQNQTGSVSVTVWPLPEADYTQSAIVCETRDVSFTDQSNPNSSSLTSWLWDFNDPSSGTQNTSTAKNPQHVFATAGTYNIKLTVTNSNGCVSINTVKPLVVNPRAKAGYINPEVCLDDSYAQFRDTSKVAAPGNITEWNWLFDDANWNTPPVSPNTSTQQNPRHSYKAVGNYDVRLIVNTNHGCQDTLTQRLVVNGSNPISKFRVLNPGRLCANDSIAIVDSSTVFPGVVTRIEIWWDDANQPTVLEADENTKLGKIYKHLYPNFQAPLTKNFRIRFRAYSGAVCLNESTQDITLNAAPKVAFDPIPNICFDAAAYQITQARETGAVPGSFAFSGPGISSTGLFNPATAGAGTHTIKYLFTANAGGCADSINQTIKVWTRAIADFDVSTTPVCEKQAATFTDKSTSAEGKITQWQWDFSDGSAIEIRNNANPFTHIFPRFGSYEVKLTVLTENGCYSEVKKKTINVEPLARPNFTFPAVSCLPNAIIAFTNTSTIPIGDPTKFQYTWNFGDPGSGAANSSNIKDPAHTYANLGPFNVKLTVTSAAGCVHDTTIVLNTLHPQPLASFTTDQTDLCLGKAILFTNTSDPLDGTTQSINWDLGDGTTKTTASFSHTYTTAGNYRVNLYIINSFNCTSTIATRNLSINPIPKVDAGPDRVVLEGGYITINATATNATGMTYVWTPPLGLDNPTLLNPKAAPPQDTRYLLTVTSDKGCSDTSSMFIKVLYKPVVPNTFTPNGDGINDRWDILYIDSYPGSVVEVYNTTGALIFRSVGYGIPWDGSNNGRPLPAGTYYYVLDPKNGRAKMAGYVTILR